MVNILKADECLENLAGISADVYVGIKSDLEAPMTAEENVYSTPTFASGKGLYKIQGKNEAQKVSFSSLGPRKGYDLGITIVIEPLLEIVCSLILGSILGFVMSRLEKLFYSNTNRLSMTISFVFLTIALCFLEIPVGGVTISFSSLLVCMMLGTVFVNCAEFSDDIMRRAEKWTAPLTACFFVISGAELELNVFARWEYVVIGVVYLLARSLGKYLGARESARMTRCSREVIRYLGITLLPQAGVALGMCNAAQALGGGEASIIRNVTLFGVFIYELIGPLLTRNALTAAGEIKQKPDEKMDRSRFKPAGQ